ncbi:MAG: hypothetical protein GXP15_03710 [Gammaproteobacteria bacterium]|nr:hypothetical protein [Gammaproteobacteria bacterium]
MSGFFHPLWLIALAVIPLIRWLHRWHAPLSSWPVSAVFLWGYTTSNESAGHRKDEPEPAWRRRALAAALLITALAGPYLSTETRTLSVWIDDSLSAFAIENGNSRIAMMFESLTEELDSNDVPWDQITLRSLTKPGKARPYGGADSFHPVDWRDAMETNLDENAMPILTTDSNHWLLTDGASAETQTWAARVYLGRIIQAGTATENAAITRLAARRSVEDAKTFDVLISVANTGVATDERRVTLYSGEEQLQTTRLSLAPGQTTHWQVRAAATNGSLTASLSSTDPLVDDDDLSISLARFEPLATRIEATCGPALWRALSAHPSLAIVDATRTAALAVSCSQDGFAEAGSSEARIRTLLGSARPVSSPPAWFASSGSGNNLGLAVDWISATQWPPRQPGDRHDVLLATTDQPLVVVHAGESGSSTIIDTVIDLNHPRFIQQAEYAAFIAALVDIATGRTLLDEAVTVSREARHSVIAPTLLDTRVRPSKPVHQVTYKPLSTLFLAVAFLLLLFDAVVLLRARMGASHA